MKLDKTLILNTIKDYYSFKKDADFARFLEIKPQTLATWYTRNTFDIELLYSKCEDIDGNFLLSGKGNIIRREVNLLKTDENGEEKKEDFQEINMKLNDENTSLKETNELLRFKIEVLENRISEHNYARSEPTIYKPVAEPEPELIQKDSKDDKAKK